MFGFILAIGSVHILYMKLTEPFRSVVKSLYIDSYNNRPIYIDLHVYRSIDDVS